ncbi:MAG TPA: rhomboid family intramembrane serine protease [Myxococcota bacterium]|nr:rhomboid family intramembrane serine protease [Myxococcota bacterium]HNZ03398.1 rhomboid family intramembrane serine protease [Myxococcota bacterium]HPB51262.1 rhomboid family intramembrane serine protease [Myxococcota bacterium]HQP95131.1 rhomboid family intramembrane serine protease [Myxococcota bacterium]
MFFPYGDTPNPQGFKPWMTRLLIFLNFAVFFLVTVPLSRQAQLGDGADVAELLEYLRQRFPGRTLQSLLEGLTRYDVFTFVHGYKAGDPSFLDLMASLFMHGSVWHLLGNMLFLWIYGDNVEHRLGRVGFLLTYLVTGVVATLTFGLFASDSMTPMIGASGAISGILGVYFVLFGANRIKVFVFLFPFLVTRWYVPARVVLSFYLVIDNLLPFVVGVDSGVAYGAHIGGFVGGLVIGLVASRINTEALKRKLFPAKRVVIREVPRTGRPDPRSIVIDAEYVDDDQDQGFTKRP